MLAKAIRERLIYFSLRMKLLIVDKQNAGEKIWLQSVAFHGMDIFFCQGMLETFRFWTKYNWSYDRLHLNKKILAIDS